VGLFSLQWLERWRAILISLAIFPVLVPYCSYNVHCKHSCASEPARVARQIVDAGFTPSYDYALQTIEEIPYVRWREYTPEDAVRFYALRLREAGMIKSSPNKILADGTDWRHWNELKRELKG
jgi:hypothetical protein